MLSKYFLSILLLSLGIPYGEAAFLSQQQERQHFLAIQQRHLERNEFSFFFGKRAYLKTYSFEEIGSLTYEQLILDIVAFSKICDFAMAEKTVELLEGRLKNNDLSTYGPILKKAKEYYELRMKLFPEVVKAVSTKVEGVSLNWKVPNSYLKEIKNPNLLKVAVESKCE